VKNKREFGRMLPREVFDHFVEEEGTGKKRRLADTLPLLDNPGVYVLYRDDVPHYVGQATKLRQRLFLHACIPGSPYYNFWNFFSVFAIKDKAHRNEIEAILIAAMPTANSAKPRLERQPFPKSLRDMLRRIRQAKVDREVLGPSH